MSLTTSLNCSYKACRPRNSPVARICPIILQTSYRTGKTNSLQIQRRKERKVIAKGSSSTVTLNLDRDLEVPSEGFSSINDALSDLANGKFVVVVDDENRENEGDLIINGDKMTTEKMAFLVEHSSGVVCMAMEAADLKRIDLPLMLNSKENFESMYTAFTITVDAAEGTTTGISASDRSTTIRRMANPKSTALDFRRPGHIFPLRYKEGGVLIRPGHTEAGVDLARLSGSFPGSALCEVVNKADGSMSRTPELLAFAEKHGLRCITIADLIRYRLRKEKLVDVVASPQLPKTLQTPFGPAAIHVFRSKFFKAPHSAASLEHVALIFGDVSKASGSGNAPLVHFHAGNPISDLFDLAGGAGALQTFGSELAKQQGTQPSAAGVILYLNSGSSSPSELGDLTVDLNSHEDLSGSVQNGTSAGGFVGLKTAAEAVQILCSLGVSAARLPALAAQTAAAGERRAHLSRALKSCGLELL